jgi:Cys-tRNA(Pro)/Cys-tRNA(Cys) deacylase
VRGGISPLGQRKRLPTVIDDSAQGLDLMYVSAGRRGLQVCLAPADLIRLTGATVAAIRT